jgi:hypothetical protein
MTFANNVASIRRGIAAAKEDRSTFYGFYTGENSIDLFEDFIHEMPKLMFDGDPVAAYAYGKRMTRYAERMETILADTPASATN